MGIEDNTVIYARYSSHGQSEQSIEGQLRDCYAFAQREGLRVVGEYVDRAITGRTDDRPDFQRMIADAGKNQFTRIIVWKLDRFARNRYDSAHYKAKLKKYGVRVVSATENITDEPEGIILEGLLESMAEYYSANLSKHVKRGQRESVLKGTWIGGVPPIGYKLVDKRPVIDEEKAPIIRFAFEQYAKGVPKKQIVDELNARGVRNGKGNLLTLSSFQTALRNKKYIGVWTYGGEEVQGEFPAMIDKEVFDRVQRRLDEVKHAPAVQKAKIDYLLQGKAFCGMCGAPMVGESGRSKGGNVYHYYACADKKKKHTCNKKNEKKGFLEWYVVEQTVEYVLTPERIDYIADRVVAQYEKEFSGGEVRRLEKLVAQLDKDIKAAVDSSLQAPESARKHYYEKIEVLDAQKADAEFDLSSIKLGAGLHYTKEQIVAWMKLFCKGDPLDEEFQRRIIDVFINSVYVYDDKLVIYYNVKGGKQISYMKMLESTEEVPDDLEPLDSAAGVRISNAFPRHFHQPYLAEQKFPAHPAGDFLRSAAPGF